VLVEVGALISWCIYSYRIVMLLVHDVLALLCLVYPQQENLQRGRLQVNKNLQMKIR